MATAIAHPTTFNLSAAAVHVIAALDPDRPGGPDKHADVIDLWMDLCETTDRDAAIDYAIAVVMTNRIEKATALPW